MSQFYQGINVTRLEIVDHDASGIDSSTNSRDSAEEIASRNIVPVFRIRRLCIVYIITSSSPTLNIIATLRRSSCGNNFNTSDAHTVSRLPLRVASDMAYDVRAFCQSAK